MRLWHFGLALEDARMAAHTVAPWRALSLTELIAMGLLLLGCIGGIAIPRDVEWSISQAKSFLTSGRAFIVLQATAIVPLYLWMRVEQKASRVLLYADYEPQSSKVRTLYAASILSGWVLAANLLLWWMPRGIWVMILAMTPLAIFAMMRPGAQGALIGFLCGGLWWSAGNAFFAIHSPNELILLSFDVEPGLQAIVRFLGVAFLATALFRLLESIVPASGLAIAASVGLGLALLIEGSLAIWLVDGGAQVGVGSFVQSQRAGFRTFFHLLAFLGFMGAALAWTAMIRPRWLRGS